MARKDAITGKKAMSGNKRSHAMNHSKRLFGLNLQKATIKDKNGAKRTVLVTAKTKKTLRKDNKLI